MSRNKPECSDTINKILANLKPHWKQRRREIKKLSTEEVYAKCGAEVGSILTSDSIKEAKRRLQNKSPKQLRILRSYDFSRTIRQHLSRRSEQIMLAPFFMLDKSITFQYNREMRQIGRLASNLTECTLNTRERLAMLSRRSRSPATFSPQASADL